MALSSAAAPAEAVRPRHAWVSGIIIALFIALASALLPGSIPSTQTVGSAFNPATTQVALSREESEQFSFAAPVDDVPKPALDGGDAGRFHIIATAALAAAALGEAYRPLHAASPPFPDLPAAARPGTGPRAPPARA